MFLSKASLLALLFAAPAGAWNCCESPDGDGDTCCMAVSAPAGKGVYFTPDCAAGGPWCDAGGYSCCRFCADDCSPYEAMGVDCVPCPGTEVTASDASTSSDARSCCTTDTDCEAKIDGGEQEYLSLYDKSIICVPDCVGLHCNMFGTCQDCRGCYNTCEGAAYYIATHPGTPSSEITWCPDSGLTNYDVDCLSSPTPSPINGDVTLAPVSADVCDCDAEITDMGKTWLCETGKSIYCDISCEEGGLWCDAWGYANCRFCDYTCEGYEPDSCVLCPADATDYSSYCSTSAPTPAPVVGDLTSSPTYAPTSADVYTFAPTSAPTSADITGSPTYAPTMAPTYAPTAADITGAPTYAPTAAPSVADIPTGAPTFGPTPAPTYAPTYAPTAADVTGAPTYAPTAAPSVADIPTGAPTFGPTPAPTSAPTYAPTAADITGAPTYAPTMAPTAADIPTGAPTFGPTPAPTMAPTYAPTAADVTGAPTYAPTAAPTAVDVITGAPTFGPTPSPTYAPTAAPTYAPTTADLTGAPTYAPTMAPTGAPVGF